MTGCKGLRRALGATALISLCGVSPALAADPRVRRAYLGEEDD